jgi:hypothetical protein
MVMTGLLEIIWELGQGEQKRKMFKIKIVKGHL